MMAAQRRQYTAEFKREAVRLITEHGYKAAEAARNLGISATLLRRWRQQFEEKDCAAFPGNGRLTPEQEALRRLREENKRLRMERDILKKALGFFASEPS
jgi:transposase